MSEKVERLSRDESYYISLYLSHMSVFELLSREEEISLHDKVLDGCIESRHLFINSNLRLAFGIAKRFRNCGLGFFDVIHECNIGLIRAVDKFDKSYGCKFSTYATRWINESILRSLQEKGSLIKIPAVPYKKIKKFNKMIEAGKKELGKQYLTREEKAHYSGLEIDEVLTLEIFMETGTNYSLDFDTNNIDDRGYSEIESISYDVLTEPYSESIKLERHKTIDRITESLTERETIVLKLRYGIYPYKACLLDEIGSQIGLSRERARQIELGIMRKLRMRVERNKCLSEDIKNMIDELS